MDSKIVFLFPSKSRPEKFFKTLDNLNEMCMTDNWEVTAILESNDASMATGYVREKINTYPKLSAFYTNTTGKVASINEGLNWFPKKYDILVLIADDIIFTEKGFDYHIISDMQQYFPDLDGILHYPDDISAVGERQITMPVMGKKLLDSWGYIYHPSYQSVWCDNEQLEVAKKTGKHKFIRTYFYQHNHPAFSKGENDDLYKHNESFYQTDKDNYFKRLALNFNLC